MTASFPRRKLHEAEQKRLAELEEERRHRLGQGKDVSDLELIIADRSLDTGGDVKTLALEGQPLLTQHGEVAEGAIVPHDQKVEEVNEDPVRPVWKPNVGRPTQRNSHRSRPSTNISDRTTTKGHTWSGPLSLEKIGVD